MKTQILCALFALLTNLASAQNIPGLPPTLFPSVVTPSMPTSIDEIFLTISHERCIGVQGSLLDFSPVVANGIVTIQIPGAVEIDPIFCFYPRRTTRLALGRIVAGTYTVELRIRPGIFPISEPGSVVQRIPLVVGPAPFSVEQVPTTKPIGLVFLILSFVMLGSVFVPRTG